MVKSVALDESRNSRERWTNTIRNLCNLLLWSFCDHAKPAANAVAEQFVSKRGYWSRFISCPQCSSKNFL